MPLRRILLFFALTGTLAGCGDGVPGATDEMFVGFDQEVVREVLADPAAVKAVHNLPEESQESAWQMNVAEFQGCRSLYSSYQQWISTGEQPPWVSWPRPANPAGLYLEQAEATEKAQRKAYESGDPGEVAAYLTASVSCGTWVPVHPGDRTGPTIAKALVQG